MKSVSLFTFLHRMFDSPRCDMMACENPKHGRVHFQKGTGVPYVPNNLLVQAVLETPAVRALQRLGRIGYSTDALVRSFAPKCEGCGGTGTIKSDGGARPCFLCNRDALTAPVYQAGGPC